MEERQASASADKKTNMGSYLLTFLLVLNLGALAGQMRLFQAMEKKKEDLEAQGLRMVADSLHRQAQVDSLNRALQWAVRVDTTTKTTVKTN